jgi:hypothetical protein
LDELKIYFSFTGKETPVKLIAFASRLRKQAVKLTVLALRPFKQSKSQRKFCRIE